MQIRERKRHTHTTYSISQSAGVWQSLQSAKAHTLTPSDPQNNFRVISLNALQHSQTPWDRGRERLRIFTKALPLSVVLPAAACMGSTAENRFIPLTHLVLKRNSSFIEPSFFFFMVFNIIPISNHKVTLTKWIAEMWEQGETAKKTSNEAKHWAKRGLHRAEGVGRVGGNLL